MRILQLTPGTGSFLCGSCLRDNALVVALRRLGHDATIVPLYLPFVMEEGGEPTTDEPVRMGGIHVYLQEKLPGFGRLPRALTGWLDSPRLLRWASTRSGMTDPAGLGAMTLSMLRGEHGRQAAEVETLARQLHALGHPDVVLLSNAMLVGLTHRLHEVLEAPILCTLQGEAPFLDALHEPYRTQCWDELAARAQEVAGFVAVSDYTARLMSERLRVDRSRIHVVPNGLELGDFRPADAPPQRPTVGFLARLCDDKGLPELVDAFLRVRERGRVPGVRLEAAGVVLPEDRRGLAELERRVRAAGAEADVRFRPNVSREEKIEHLRSLSVLSVPARYGESFGLYLIEAMASGVPVVQPRCGGFPEVVEATGGGVLFDPDAEHGLADALEALLTDLEHARALGRAGRAAVNERYTAARMAHAVADICRMTADTAS